MTDRNLRHQYSLIAEPRDLAACWAADSGSLFVQSLFSGTHAEGRGIPPG